MANCSFCGNALSKGTGLLYAKKDGSIMYFCSAKCKKNMLTLGREGRRVKWTSKARAFKSSK